eukprot:Pompholyxophrys_punicea_v1_NODE_111_length_3409_cov_6.614056.p2 type:complete len:118 gc:universal NODE_111_length_3409_cov_6.614056:2300-2653(+)
MAPKEGTQNERESRSAKIAELAQDLDTEKTKRRKLEEEVATLRSDLFLLEEKLLDAALASVKTPSQVSSASVPTQASPSSAQIQVLNLARCFNLSNFCLEFRLRMSHYHGLPQRIRP